MLALKLILRSLTRTSPLLRGGLALFATAVIHSALQAAPAFASSQMDISEAPQSFEPDTLIDEELGMRRSDFYQIPSAHSVEESHHYFPLRKEAILRRYVDFSLPVFDRANARRFTVISMARLELGTPEQIAEVNLRILEAATRPFAEVGTDFQRFGKACKRVGDYDFAQFGLTLLVARYWNQPHLLWPETQNKILDQLLLETGSKIEKFRWFKLCGWWAETENHILLTEISQYIANQLWLKRIEAQGTPDPSEIRYFRNSSNGMDRFFLEHLQQFVKHDFHELNSRPYQKLTVWALLGLHEFAENRQVRDAAQIVLDYLAAKFAIASKNSRRSVPFRRQPQYRFDPQLITTDPESVRMFLYVGNTDFFSVLNPDTRLDSWLQVFGSVASYRVPDIILDLIHGNERSHRFYWQGMRHGAWEVYSGGPSYLISGGGRWVNAFDFWTGDLSVWAMPTLLIPANGPASREFLLQIAGDRDERQRNNLCVAPGFACGLNVRIPDSIPDSCRSKPSEKSAWTFLNFNSAECPLRWGHWVAVYQEPCDSFRCRRSASNWGFFEVAEPSSQSSFEDFMTKVVSRNQPDDWKSGRVNTYIKSDGIEIDFNAHPFREKAWGIHRYGKREFSQNDKEWPLIWGPFVQATGDGLVRIKNPDLRQELILDYRNATNPLIQLRAGQLQSP
jgi:hypothetical protein